MEDVALNLMHSALWAGVPYKDIGPMAPIDIKIAADVELEKQKEFYRMMAWLVYNCASLVAIGFNNPKKFPSIEDAFPRMFEKKGQQDWWIMKQRMEDYSLRNSKISGDS